jgi:hypothetical protein
MGLLIYRDKAKRNEDLELLSNLAVHFHSLHKYALVLMDV